MLVTYYIVAAGLLLHALYWGAGLAVLVMPRPWQRFWPVLAPSGGLTLQSLAVWAGAYANLPGSNSYAWWSESIPAAMLLAALWRRESRRLLSDLARLRNLWLAMAVVLVVVVTPLAGAADFLTTISLGSNDAPDYAAGARVLMEFARSDRTGFLGLTEVVSVKSVDNFFDFWMRLNHFTPSALIALNASILGREAYEITGLLTAVLLVLSMPGVFWLARAVLHYRASLSVWLALIYCLSPVTWYAVFHVAPAQLLAAQAIALITWSGVALWQSGLGWRRGLAMSGVLATSYALLLGSYNFIVLVCLAPAGAYVLGMTIWKDRWSELVRWTFFMFLPLAAAGVVLAERVAGLPERLVLFRTIDFGWRIPTFTPEGWLGMVQGPALDGFTLWARILLALVVMASLAATFFQTARRRQVTGFLVICLLVPALAGYGYLSLRGYMLDNNASYDAYKLLSVFYPGVLAAACYWLTLERQDGPAWAALRAVMVVVVSGFTLNAMYTFSVRLRDAPLMVTPALAQLGEFEAMPEVTSINIHISDLWSRLWANAFLLRKPQYFSSHTYEGRRGTPLRGEWDLNDGYVQVRLSGSKVATSRYFSLVSTRDPFFLRAREVDGWYHLEQNARTGEHWRWSHGVITTVIENPHHYPLLTTWYIQQASSLEHRDFQMSLAGKPVGQTVTGVGKKPRDIVIPSVLVPPGETSVQFSTSSPLTRPGNGDTRLLGFRIQGIQIEVHDGPATAIVPGGGPPEAVENLTDPITR
jgi:hypothetical protein